MAKKIALKPKVAPKEQTQESWVSAGRETKKEPEKLRRLTLDLEEDLHRAIKRQAVEEGTTMVALLRDLLSKHFKI